MAASIAEPFLRWAGSKRKSLDVLKAYWNPDSGKYIEPFVGSASLFFRVRPRRAVLSDINGDLIETFRSVRKQPRAVFESLRCRPINADYYYALREIDPQRQSSARRAARFIYLNRFCFNGLYRTNRSGKFNVPFSGQRTGKKPGEAHLLRCSKALRNASLLRSDFEAVIRKHTERGDFVYLDPPYATGARRIFGQYDPGSFSTVDLARLAEVLNEIGRRGATFVLSYAYCPEALRLFSNWTQQRLFVQRNIAGFAGDRRMAAELLVTNAR